MKCNNKNNYKWNYLNNKRQNIPNIKKLIKEMDEISNEHCSCLLSYYDEHLFMFNIIKNMNLNNTNEILNEHYSCNNMNERITWMNLQQLTTAYRFILKYRLSRYRMPGLWRNVMKKTQKRNMSILVNWQIAERNILTFL